MRDELSLEWINIDDILAWLSVCQNCQEELLFRAKYGLLHIPISVRRLRTRKLPGGSLVEIDGLLRQIISRQCLGREPAFFRYISASQGWRRTTPSGENYKYLGPGIIDQASTDLTLDDHVTQYTYFTPGTWLKRVGPLR